MKKIILVFTVLLSVTLLTGCDTVDIVPDVMNVVYENARYEDGNFYIETHITNGTDEDVYIEYMEFGIYPEGNDTEIAGAGFDINETIKAGKYVSIELEFSSEFVFFSEAELLVLGFTVDDLELYFWII
jgi:hypothetical protein